MKITIYELLGLSRNIENEIYVKYHNRLTEQDDVMWACKENIVYKLDQNIVYLDDEVEILDEPKEHKKIIKMKEENGWCGKQSTGNEIILKMKVNELIDEVNKLKVNNESR